MAARLPVCSGRRAIRALEAAGFFLVRVNGSHHIFRHSGPPLRNVTIPVHGTKPLKRATLHSIIKQSGLSAEEFIALL